MHKSTKKRPSKETVVGPGRPPNKQIKSSNSQEQIHIDRDYNNNQIWFSNSEDVNQINTPLTFEEDSGASFDSDDSQPEDTLQNVLPVEVVDDDNDDDEEESCEMDVDENSPDPRYSTFAEHCIHQTIKIGKKGSSSDSVLQAACALLNSGGGVLKIKIDNYTEFKCPRKELDKFWQGIEEKLEAAVEPLTYDKVFDRDIKQDEVFLFIRAPDHWCTLDYNLYFPGDSRVLKNDSFSKAVDLLNKPYGKKTKHCKVGLEKLPSLPGKFRFEEKLNFHESKQIEFKCYPSDNPITHNNSRQEREKIVKKISAFANGNGGIILIGVTDDCKVLGQNMASEGNSKDDVEQRLDSVINEMKWSCTPERKVHWDVKFFPVQGKESCSVIAIYVAGINGGVFSKRPKSYELRPGDDGQDEIYPLEFDEWKQRMLSGRHILQNESKAMKHLTEKFRALSTSSGVLLSLKDSVGKIRDSFFPVKAGCPVSPDGFESNLPETAQKVIRQIQRLFSEGRKRALLVGSPSWLSCIKKDDEENSRVDGAICDLLLFNADLGGLHLFTLRDSEQVEQFLSYSHSTAKTLKKALVTDGGCREKFYITCHVVPCCSASVQIGPLSPDNRYPDEYDLGSSRGKLNEILSSLVRILAAVPSALSSKQGICFFNLLTKEQYQLLHQEMKRHRELWIKGAAGTGKTLVAAEFMKELLQSYPSLQPIEILYVCENKGIREQVRKHGICHPVCRRTFMEDDFFEVKHVVMDEVQSFRDEDRGEDGDDWLQKARKVVRQHSAYDPGFLWLFIDNRQINHWYPTGIPAERNQTPSFTLTKVIRNSNRIFKFSSKKIFNKEALAEVQIGHDFEGELILGRRYSGDEKSQIAELKKVLQSLFTEGYSEGDITVLYGQTNCIPNYLHSKLGLGLTIVEAVANDSRNLVVSTFRKYSGLERPVVILVNIERSLPYKSNENSALYCCGTRAMVKLVTLTPKR